MGYHLSTEENCSEEIRENENNLYKHLILKKLRKILDNDQEILSHLQNVYMDVSKSKQPFFVVNLPNETEEEYLLRSIDSVLFEIGSISINLFLNGVIEAAKDDNCYLANIYILMFNLEDKRTGFLGTTKIFDESAVLLFIQELKRAVDNGLIEKSHTSVINALAGDFNPREFPLYGFLKDIQEENPKYIHMSMDDDCYNLFNYYKEVKEINYTKLITSERFQNFIKTANYSNSDFENMSEIFESYFLEEELSEDDMEEALINAVLNKDKYERHLITEKRIKELMFESSQKSLFEINRD